MRGTVAKRLRKEARERFPSDSLEVFYAEITVTNQSTNLKKIAKKGKTSRIVVLESGIRTFYKELKKAYNFKKRA